ncbi:YbhB/YbcL family Raf kinase inhibitor-like protein [candidate division KSB1 bacterium]|nr:MAG: YbhB/YbcL family Raf kinase inhibitor-like protein [candidate division KSB1 bacterium]
MTIATTAFSDSAPIPKKFSCLGKNVSPPLAIGGVPADAKSLTLICDDPDAPMGTWTHWVLWNIPPSTPSLPEGMPKEATLPGGMKQGINSGMDIGYDGPCPPPGKPHRYFFKLFALDSVISLSDKADKKALEDAMKGHVLAQAQTMGTFTR